MSTPPSAPLSQSQPPPTDADSSAGRRHIGIVSPCLDEEENVQELYERVRNAMESNPKYTWELLFIDNASTDGTVERIRAICSQDPRVKAIVNARNFGHIRSPFHGFLEVPGDAVICLASDLQDPPELIADYLAKWESGYLVVVGTKLSSEESRAFYLLRSIYYRFARRMAEVPLLEHVTGFGLYDRRVVEILRSMEDPYPYMRGLISEIGLPIAKIPYRQPLRRRGISKNNFYTLFDMAMLGTTTHSKVPLRVATLAGFSLAVLSMFAALSYFVFKLVFWDWFPAGVAPILIGVFFFASVQLFFIGLLGEYIGAVLTQVRRRPIVVEKERINFEPGTPAKPWVAGPTDRRPGS